MKTYGQHCALARALDRVGERWTLLIVRELLVGPRRYSDLHEALPGIATNLLASRLQQLDADGLVRRRTLPPPSASQVYELTEAGAELAEAVHALVRWGGRWMGDRQPEDAFRVDWLVVALRALLAPTGVEGKWLVEVDTGSAVRIQARADDVEVDPADTAPEDAPVLRADAETVLGLAAGRLSLAAAERAGDAAFDGPRAARRALAGLLPA